MQQLLFFLLNMPQLFDLLPQFFHSLKNLLLKVDLFHDLGLVFSHIVVINTDQIPKIRICQSWFKLRDL